MGDFIFNLMALNTESLPLMVVHIHYLKIHWDLRKLQLNQDKVLQQV